MHRLFTFSNADIALAVPYPGHRFPFQPLITHKSNVEDVATWLASLRCSSALASQRYADAVRAAGVDGTGILGRDPEDTIENLKVSII